MCKTIYLDAPKLGESEKDFLNQAIDSGFVSSTGPFVPKFEEKFSRYLGVADAASTQSGTSALHISLYELEIGPGDEVIVPALTFVATVNPIVYVGARPVFVDVEPDTWNIDPCEIENNITQTTKAIIPVHLYGNPCNLDEIEKIARKHGLFIIEDATESLGAIYKGQHVGTGGDFGCFSFNGNKMITTGGGGMVVCKDKQKLEHIKFLVNQAKGAGETLLHTEIGFNFRMTNIEAALGLAQMTRLDEFVKKKNLFYQIYREELKNIRGIEFQSEPEGGRSARWLTTILINKEIPINLIQDKLAREGIQTRRTFMPVVEFLPYQKFRKRALSNSSRIYEKGLCLPSSTLNSIDDIHYTCRKLKALI